MRILLLAILAIGACMAQHNTLTSKERAEGWKLLFDGKSFAGWVDPTKKSPPSDAWSVADGTLKTTPHSRTREDLGSAEKFRDFELVFDWKVSPKGNSGVKYRLQDSVLLDVEKLPKGVPFEQQVEYAYGKKFTRAGLSPGTRYEEYTVGFEFQVIDDAGHVDAMRGGKYQAGALYAMHPASKAMAKPAGEWNTARLVVMGKHVEHWLNREKVVDTTLDSEGVIAAIEARWKKAPSILRMLTEQPTAESAIVLQHHVDEVWFRNIKIRRISGK
jgi:hypothetical protein